MFVQKAQTKVNLNQCYTAIKYKDDQSTVRQNMLKETEGTLSRSRTLYASQLIDEGGNSKRFYL